MIVQSSLVFNTSIIISQDGTFVMVYRLQRMRENILFCKLNLSSHNQARHRCCLLKATMAGINTISNEQNPILLTRKWNLVMGILQVDTKRVNAVFVVSTEALPQVLSVAAGSSIHLCRWELINAYHILSKSIKFFNQIDAYLQINYRTV